MVFGSILASFLDEFSCFFHGLFEAVFLMICLRFLDRSQTSANPKIIEISMVLLAYFALGTFHRRSIFGSICDEFQCHFRIDFSLIFMTFSASNLALIFASIFHGKWLQKRGRKSL